MDYLELAVPLNMYETGVVNPTELTDQGMVEPNDKPGWGVEIDWETLSNSVTLHVTVE
ncbi:hypothetical protein [Actinotignum urinale]|uniref:hypothetical protein n=1 Tax=Actinotignum urinale TaxID=190146 RepID=UPI00280C0DC7|nr:hypothetical protein [Actinotignum urinale]